MLDLRLEPGVVDTVPLCLSGDFRPECYAPAMSRDDEERDTDRAPPPKETPFPGTRLGYRLGDTGEPIEIIQRAVNVADHGTFDLVTEVGVKAFQTAHGLPSTGIVDPKTWMAMSVSSPWEA